MGFGPGKLRKKHGVEGRIADCGLKKGAQRDCEFRIWELRNWGILDFRLQIAGR
jgi:hypothetical protein